MGRKTAARDLVDIADTLQAVPADPIERIVRQIIGELAVLDGKVFAAALSEMKERPRTSLRYVLKLFTSGEPEARAIAARILLRCETASLVDDMNAIIFDVEQDAWTRVVANDLLAQSGSAVDPDVFAMSVPDAESLQEKLPSRTWKLLSEGGLDVALAHARALHPAERWLVIHDAVERGGEQAVSFIRALASDGEDNAIAAVSAIAEAKLEAGVLLLLELQATADHALQKLIKRTLFEMRKAGVDVPADKPPDATARVSEAAAAGPVVVRALMSPPAARVPILVVIGWKRPNGRLQVFSVLVDLWKRGISDAVLRRDMSRSAFERFVNANTGNRPPLDEASFEDCCAMIARGVRVAREFGSRLPLDLGLGKKLLHGFDEQVDGIENPFLCSECGHPLDAATIERIKADAPYDNIPPETRCEACR